MHFQRRIGEKTTLKVLWEEEKQCGPVWKVWINCQRTSTAAASKSQRGSNLEIEVRLDCSNQPMVTETEGEYMQVQTGAIAAGGCWHLPMDPVKWRVIFVSSKFPETVPAPCLREGRHHFGLGQQLQRPWCTSTAAD